MGYMIQPWVRWMHLEREPLLSRDILDDQHQHALSKALMHVLDAGVPHVA